MAQYPPGIRPDGAGLRIRLFRRGKQVYSETIKGDPLSKSFIAAAKKRREWLIARQQLGLPLHEGDQSEALLFKPAAQDYLNTLEAKYSTHMSYESILNTHWLQCYKDWPVTEITTADIKRRLAAMDISGKTKKNILIPLRGVLRHAEVNPNPVDAITVKRTQREPVQRYTPEEKDRLLAKLDGQALVYFTLLFATGIRPGEALGLLWTDYNGEELSISKQITRRRLQDSTKTNTRRIVYVPQWARPCLNSHPTRFDGGHIFQTEAGDHHRDTDVLNNAWRKAHRLARVPYRIPYTCRHTRAAELLSMGINPADAAKQLGHSTEIFLRTYSEFMESYAGASDYSRFEPATGEKLAKNEGKK